jgi:hypothetical protein
MNVELEFEEQLLGQPERARGAQAELEAQLASQQLLFGDSIIPTSLKPHFVDSTVHRSWVTTSERVLALLEKVSKLLLEDRALFAMLKLPAASRALIEIPSGYESVVVLSRPDAVYDGARLRFVEINADSPAMMTMADHVQRIQLGLFPVAALADRWRMSFAERTPRLLEALLSRYREWGGHGPPTIAIVDWEGEKTRHELLRTAEDFQKSGFEAVVASPRQLSLTGSRLEVAGRPVDLVYRRVLFTDFITRSAELAPLLEAYRRGWVCMVNPLRAYLVGTKTLLAMLHGDELQSHLSTEERELVTSAIAFTCTPLGVWGDRVQRERPDWVLKKAESHGGHHVAIGALMEDRQWEAAFREAETSPWVAQRFEPVPRYRLPDLKPGAPAALSDRFINWNPFLFGGRFAGAIARASDSMLINITLGGALIPTATVTAPTHAAAYVP